MDIQSSKVQEIISKQWRRINPYFEDEFDIAEYANTKNIIAILDDFYSIISEVPTDEFIAPICSFFDNNVVARGRRGRWNMASQLAPPSIEVAKANNIINRWNPPDKRFLYLAVGDTEKVRETVFAEMRAKAGEELTVGDFSLRDYAKTKKIINLDFGAISRTDIFEELERAKNSTVKQIVGELQPLCCRPTEAVVKSKIAAVHHQTENTVKVFCGRLLLKELGDVIFVPLDSDEDNDSSQKDICYKAFHVLAEYFENKGYAGIAFPSTRMMLQGKHGTNLVLFDADSAYALEETMRTLIVECEDNGNE